MRRAWLAAMALMAFGLGALTWLDRGETGGGSAPAAADPREERARGEYLARAGNCAGCHTRRGGAPFAGGRAIETPFGSVFAPNLTPDEQTGIGAWSREDFWKALHEGRSRGGRLLYPAFPYPNYTQVTRADSDALFAYLRSLPPVREPNRAHALRFPYNFQLTLAGWRALFFRPGVFEADPGRSPEWNRGAYLVRGLGHCSACHGSRNVLGATAGSMDLGGGVIPALGWYAPSLASKREAGVAGWTIDEAVALLKTGVSARASVLGPMAEVVFRSTQHLSDADLRAIAAFLQSLPEEEADAGPGAPARPDALALGRRIYERHCDDCHGRAGEGVAGKYPALAGNRAVTLRWAGNAIRAVLAGGYPPGTAGNPRPYGMPPYAPFLTDHEVAAVVTYIRNAWGNRAGAVDGREVDRHRGGTLR